MREIPLNGPKAQGKFLQVDDEDYELMSQFQWYLSSDGNYAQSNILAHQLVVNYNLIDHRNGDGLDNRSSNLREATLSQNGGNRRLNKNSRTGFKGVSYHKIRDAFLASIKVDGKSKYLGYFKNPVDAAKAYDNAAREYFGEFARLNFPETAVA